MILKVVSKNLIIKLNKSKITTNNINNNKVSNLNKDNIV